MRVLVVTNMYPSTDKPNAGVFVEREVHALRALGVEIEVVCVNTIERTYRYMTGLVTVQEAVTRFDPDVIHVHYGLVQLPALGARKPLVCTFHGSDLNTPWQRVISAGLAHRLDCAVVVSSRLAHLLPRNIESVVIPCGTPTSIFSPVERGLARSTSGIPDTSVVLGFAGSPSRAVKRYDRFVEVCARLPETHPVILTGIEPHDMATWLSAIDCLVLTSDTEGSPVVTKEALCCGTRVVSTPVGDLTDQIRGLSGCRVTKSFNATEIAACIRDVLDEPNPDSSEARSRFALEREARSVLDVYRRVVKR